MYLSYSQYQIQDAQGNAIYTAPPTSTDPQAFATGTYYGTWDQKDNSGMQVKPGTYAVVYVTAANKPAAIFAITGTSVLTTYHPNAQLSAYYVQPGQAISINGTGFAPNETILLYVENYLAKYRTDANGNLSVTNAVIFSASQANTTQKITIIATNSNEYHKEFTIGVSGYGSASISPSTYYVLPGGSLNFNGNGFAPTEQVTVQVQGQTAKTVAADTAGNLNVNHVLIPYTFAGMTAFTFTGQTSGITVSTTITVAQLHPWLILSSYYERAGSPLTINGYGFGAGEQVNITFNNGQVGSVVADQNGMISVSTMVPTSSRSPHAITIRGVGSSTGATAQATFTQAY